MGSEACRPENVEKNGDKIGNFLQIGGRNHHDPTRIRKKCHGRLHEREAQVLLYPPLSNARCTLWMIGDTQDTRYSVLCISAVYTVQCTRCRAQAKTQYARCKVKGKGKLGAHAMKRVAAGAHLPAPGLFEPAKRPDDRADYCLRQPYWFGEGLFRLQERRKLIFF